MARRFPAFRRALAGVHLVELSRRLRETQRATLGEEAVAWHSFFSEAPRDAPLLVLAQEFLDVFPVHQFVRGGRGWTETLVDVDDAPASPLYFRRCLAPSATPAVKAILDARSEPGGVYAYLCAAADRADAPEEGLGLEVSPLALSTLQQVAGALRACTGAALLIDYGEARTAGDSLRGFRGHQLVDALSSPGLVDVTADVVRPAIL